MLELRDIRPDGYNLTSDIMPKDGGVLEWEPSEGLQATVDRVDGNSAISDENLVLPWGPKRRGLYFKRLAFGSCKPCGGIRSHDMRGSRLFVDLRAVKWQIERESDGV